jgi:radical SAM superfamily enzyme YgiQ (UPF0313 family)
MTSPPSKRADVALVAANARYGHTAFGLRCLLANLGALRPRAALLEATLEERPADLAERILALEPRVVGMSVAIWSVGLLTETAAILRRVAPGVRLVAGGPEIADAADLPRIAELADVAVIGEGERAFPEIAAALLAGEHPVQRVVTAAPLDLSEIAIPHGEYTDEDISHRTLYLEASRGCPHGCEFCLSGSSRRVRRFPANRVLEAAGALWDRGARRFKFVDRSLELGDAAGLLDFFLARADAGLFLHFELVPGRLSEPLFARIARFPAGAIQLEVGVQTLDADVAARIGRRQDAASALAEIERLVSGTAAHVHADLVVGLPGEGLDGVAAGFDRLHRTGVHEIQVGVLKRLRGTPIARHAERFGMVFREAPPYDALATSAIGFAEMQRLKRAARYHDLVRNSGRFPRASRLLLDAPSAFGALLSFTDHVHERTGATAGIAPQRLGALLLEHLVAARGAAPAEVSEAISDDLRRTSERSGAAPNAATPERQRRHGRSRP